MAQKSVYNRKQLILRRLVSLWNLCPRLCSRINSKFWRIVINATIKTFAKSFSVSTFSLLKNTVLCLSRPRSLFFFCFLYLEPNENHPRENQNSQRRDAPRQSKDLVKNPRWFLCNRISAPRGITLRVMYCRNRSRNNKTLSNKQPNVYFLTNYNNVQISYIA